MNYMIQESGLKSLENLLNERNKSRGRNTMEDKDPFRKGFSNSPDRPQRLEKLSPFHDIPLLVVTKAHEYYY